MPVCRRRRGTSATGIGPKGQGAIVAFEITGGVDAGKRFVDALTLHSHVANIGDVRSPGDPSGVDHPQPVDARRAARRRR